MDIRKLTGVAKHIYSSFKREALLFEQIAIIDLDDELAILSDQETVPFLRDFVGVPYPDDTSFLRNEVEYLVENEIVIQIDGDVYNSIPNLLNADSEYLLSQTKIQELEPRFKREWEDSICNRGPIKIPYTATIYSQESNRLECFEKFFIIPIHVTRVVTSYLNADRNLAFLPIIPEYYFGRNYPIPNCSYQGVIDIVLNKLPEPDDSVPWEQVFEYRSDPDARKNYWKLRKWMREISKENLKPIEYAEKLEYLIQEYENNLKLHRMKCKWNTLEMLIVTSAEILEGLVKIKWSTTAKELFLLHQKKFDLLRTEAEMIGSEIAYIKKTHHRFPSI